MLNPDIEAWKRVYKKRIANEETVRALICSNWLEIEVLDSETDENAYKWIAINGK